MVGNKPLPGNDRLALSMPLHLTVPRRKMILLEHYPESTHLLLAALMETPVLVEDGVVVVVVAVVVVIMYYPQELIPTIGLQKI